MKNITILLINFNSEKETVACLQSLFRIKMQSFMVSVTIIDNGSSELSWDYITNFLSQQKDLPFRIKLIKNKSNLGFSGGNNTGIAVALEEKSDYILLLNNDTEVEPSFLLHLFTAVETHEYVGLASPKIYFSKGYEFHKTRYKEAELGKVIWYAGGKLDWENIIGYHRGVDEVDRGQYDQEEQTDFTTGCCMLIKRSVIEKNGLLDEKYFLYLEDLDYNIRVKKRGLKLLYVPSAVIWHKNAGSAGGSGSTTQDYFISRNRMIFGMRYAKLKTKFALVKESIRILYAGRYWQKKGIIDFYSNRLGKGSFGA